ncbi:MAG: hypothetical protein FJ299_16460, partial [Planctomycetes bacterium]|nr:hypothetical protein [Planctomycetota bacterium]
MRARPALQRLLSAVTVLLAGASASAQDRDALEAGEITPMRHQLPHSREADAQSRQATRLLDERKSSEALELLARLALSDGALVHELAGQARARGVARWAREQWLSIAGTAARRDEPGATAAIDSAL